MPPTDPADGRNVVSWPPFALDEATAARIAAIGPVLRASEDEGEANRFLPPVAVDALHDAGVFGVSTPAVLGGMEATPLVEMEVFEAVTRCSGAAGWNLFVGAVHSGLPAAYLSDDAVAEMYGGDRTPVVAGQMQPVARAHDVEGGMTVDGTFSWGSGISHAGWVLGGAIVRTPDGGRLPGFRVFVTPKAKVEVLDNWHPVGLAGSGSYDYAVHDLFIPAGWWFDYLAPVRHRGGPRFDAPIRAQIASAHIGFALGLGERALDEILALAVTKRRSLSTTTIADRGAFQRDLGQAHTRLSAARDHGAAVLLRLERCQAEGSRVTDGDVSELRAAATHVTEVALDVANMAMRYAGGSAVRLDSAIQRVARELLVAQGHMYVADSNYDTLGAALLDAHGVPEEQSDTGPGYSVPDVSAALPPGRQKPSV